jgi:hypothetical protein
MILRLGTRVEGWDEADFASYFEALRRVLEEVEAN